MKIKRFENLWTMGLIIFGVLLVAFYLAKIIFPSFVVGVAQTPRIVEFGNFVDSHLWAYHIFNGATSFLILYFYTCACCRICKLYCKETLILIAHILLSHLIEVFLPNQLLAFNFIAYLSIPLIIVAIREIKDYKIFYSTAICFIISTIAQSFSLEIRGISTLISYPNTATFCVLLIDVYIWNILLYNYFNFKESKNG